MSEEVNRKLPTKHLQNTLKHVLETLNLDPESEYSVSASPARVVISRGYKVCVSLADGSSLNLFIKCVTDNNAINESLDAPVFFKNEVSVYNNILRPFYEFQTKRLGNVLYNTSPKCYHASADGENDVLVFEDLGEKRFKMLNRLEVMPLPELKLLLGQLGRFHGLSLAVKHLDPGLFETIKHSVQETWFYPKFFEKYGSVWEYTAQDGVRLISQAFPNDADNVYVKALRKFADNMWDNMAELVSDVSPEYEEHYVITHGDLWINNFMFHYPEGTASPDALRILDYQLCRYSSPALDLSCVMFSSADKPTRDLHWDLLIHTYYDSIGDVLINFGLDPSRVFSYATLQRHLDRFSRFGIGMCVTNLPHTLDEWKGSNEDDVLATPECGSDLLLAKFTPVYRRKSELCRRWIVDNIVEAVDRGYLK